MARCAITGLGAIAIPASAADRIAFWRRLHDRLSALSNRIVDEQSKSRELGEIEAGVDMAGVAVRLPVLHCGAGRVKALGLGWRVQPRMQR
jgi:hypothetical protein